VVYRTEGWDYGESEFKVRVRAIHSIIYSVRTVCSTLVQIYNEHIKQSNDTNLRHSKERKTTAELFAQNMTTQNP